MRIETPQVEKSPITMTTNCKKLNKKTCVSFYTHTHTYTWLCRILLLCRGAYGHSHHCSVQPPWQKVDVAFATAAVQNAPHHT